MEAFDGDVEQRRLMEMLSGAFDGDAERRPVE